MAGAREAALTALEKCRRQGAWSDAVLGGVLDKYGLDGRDRAMAAALCYGVMQNVFYLDYYIELYYSGRLSRLEPKVLDILRVSACQLLLMDRIPASAAVNEGVKLCRALGYGRASGLVNAVLRRIAENAAALPEIEARDEEERLSIRWSCPLWLVRELGQQLGGGELEALLRSQNETPPVAIQRNPCRVSGEELLRELPEQGVSAREHPWLPDCCLLEHTGPIAALAAFQQGHFYVQDAAAKLAVIAAAPRAGERVLDVCAAPGGKSFAAACLTEDQAAITACDIHENKLERIREGAARLGFRSIGTQAADGRDFHPEWESAFDLVIADVPCSGLGVIRKKPDIRYKNPADFAALPEIQSAILRNVSRYVKPGGTLLYSTCTIRPEENDRVVERFLTENNSYRPEDFVLPGKRCSADGTLQLWPQRDGTDGFFIAKLRRLP